MRDVQSCASIFFSFCLIWLGASSSLLQTVQRGHGLLELGLDLVVLSGEVVVLGLKDLVVLDQLGVLTLKFLNLQIELTDPIMSGKTRVDRLATSVQLLL